MAVVRAYEPIDMAASGGVAGYVHSYDSDHIQLRSPGGIYIDNFYGQGFTFDDNWITGGVITSMYSSVWGDRVFEVTDVWADAVTVANFLAIADHSSLYEYVLQGNDAIHGSDGDDVIFAYSGNDLLFGYGGSNQLNGGSGIDTAVYDGSREDHAIRFGSIFVSIDHQDGFFSETDQLTGVERLLFADARIALDIDGNAGEAYRMYQAAFDRKPDADGLGYWIKQIDDGATLEEIGMSFIASQEFRELYGDDLTAEQYVAELYQNVLQRYPDQGGLDYWVNELQTGSLNEAKVLASFSESAENKALVLPDIGAGIQYEEWVG